MALAHKDRVVLVSTTKFNVAPVSVAAGTGAYGTAQTAGTGDWVLGSALTKGRKLIVIVETGAMANDPTALKVALHGSATDANGSSGAEIASTVTTWATPPGDTVYVTEIELSAVTDLTKYYSLALTANGAGASSTVIAGAVAIVADPTYS